MENRKIKQILIVDDEPTIMLVLARGLEILDQDYAIDTALGSQAALDKLRQQAYFMVIADHQMPSMTGLELAREIRQMAPTIYFVLMTAYSTPELYQEASELSLAGYLEKPFKLDQLWTMVKQIDQGAFHRNGDHQPLLVQSRKTKFPIKPRLSETDDEFETQSEASNLPDLWPCPTTGQLIPAKDWKFMTTSEKSVIWWRCSVCYGWHVYLFNEADSAGLPASGQRSLSQSI